MIGETEINALECESGHIYCIEDTSKHPTSVIVFSLVRCLPGVLCWSVDLTSVADLKDGFRVTIKV